jgi:hypothetical protein
MAGDDGAGASERLESLLTAEGAASQWAAAAIELRLLTRLAAPAVVMYMINYLMSMSTQIFSGHLGNLELAAASLGNAGVQMFAYGLMVRHSRILYRLCLQQHVAAAGFISPTFACLALLCFRRRGCVVVPPDSPPGSSIIRLFHFIYQATVAADPR